MAAKDTNIVEHDTKVDCRLCNITFEDWTAFHNHKLAHKDHICCDICSTDFHTEEGLKRHRTLVHPKEQDLKCMACGRKFIRLGSLINHLELDSCCAINPEERHSLAASRRQRQQLHAKFKANLKEIDDTAGPRTNNSLLDSQDISTNSLDVKLLAPIFKSSPPNFESEIVTNFEFGGWETTILEEDIPSNTFNEEIINTTPAPVMELQPEEDLISFGEVDKAMSIPWGITSKKAAKEKPKPTEEVQYEYVENSFPVAIAPSMKEDNFPPLPNGSQFRDAGMKAPNFMDAPLEDSKFTSIWDTKHMFANSRKSIAPPSIEAPAVTGVATRTGGLPPLRMRALVTPLPEKEHAPYDPKDPSFRSQRYWVAFTRKYQCPHRFCKKSYDAETAFIQHLLSAIHTSDNRLICPNCYRGFGTYTALTQHCESQGVRCKIREAVNYGKVVNDITASVADVVGKHEDETVKYTVKEEGFGDLAKKYREAGEKNAKKKVNYWENRETEFEW
ncbi:hypothetical protein BCIN_08g04580 [Botrytis cinerea B05.10]|uniref:C2H2-type domain-containing protein n=2 Tax=Botryotinia fuckeliana TaxID=40559 RepID=A0A384JQP1_BOTFB|nr:hypothetical protein BCIN_08g04580 [Botrytis cinerea B05.10]ATZ52830.1 hypothetical protein BCIN_08g04580 [Botrytis cinerea B05.10]CCD42581.1 similar to transcription factor Zn, C2H2 [Botrytis cinerea T4]